MFGAVKAKSKTRNLRGARLNLARRLVRSAALFGRRRNSFTVRAKANNFPRLSCAIGFDEKAGPYQVNCFRLLLVTISLQPSCPCQASIHTLR